MRDMRNKCDRSVMFRALEMMNRLQGENVEVSVSALLLVAATIAHDTEMDISEVHEELDFLFNNLKELPRQPPEPPEVVKRLRKLAREQQRGPSVTLIVLDAPVEQEPEEVACDKPPGKN